MNLPALLLELRPLVADIDKNWDRIVELLSTHKRLAEYEVARFFVARHVESRVTELLRSRDPQQRARGVKMLELAYPSTRAGKHLRHLVRDADVEVARDATEAVSNLDIDDVALPDFRLKPPRDPRHGWGGWNQSSWRFGFPLADWVRRKKRVGPKKLKLPKIADKAALFELLGIADEKHYKRLIRPGAQSGAPYVEFTVPKRSGGERIISAPRAELKRVQRTILDKILAKIPVHDAAHGFVPGRSTVTNAQPHVGASLVVKIDLTEFFPSIHFRRVYGLMGYYGYEHEVATALAALMTHRIKLDDGKRMVETGLVPQGAPTSPALANIVCRRLDARLSGLAQRAGARYTRYADDLTFSFADAPPDKGLGRFLWWVDAVCQQEGFVENAGKRRVLRPSHQQRVTGVVVNSQLSVPRSERRRFRAMLHNCRHKGIASQAKQHGRDEAEFRDYLTGFASYVKMVQPELGNKLAGEVADLLKGA
ncbi:MAG: RNA-directed DNA polymerase [Myxococcales bacterium]|nr:RNA-directed DNA polymerase [Myxococcales bacterium]